MKLVSELDIIIVRGKRIWSLSWYKNNKLHRNIDKPAFIAFFKNNNVHYMSWYRHGEHFRKDKKPSEIRYYKNGSIQSLSWFDRKNNMYAPATVIFNEHDSEIKKFVWGKRLNIDANNFVDWINKKGIEFYENYEIPSEHWIEFKLRFL